MNPNRGSFPKVAHPETLSEQRMRFEQWLIDTRDLGDPPCEKYPNGREAEPDPRLAAVLRQPNHDSKLARPSYEYAVRARCWECVAGDDDVGARDRIAECAVTSCRLWPARPYKKTDEAARDGDANGKPKKVMVDRREPIRQYCRECQGGESQPYVSRAVASCNIPQCALWLVRMPMRTIAKFGGEIYTAFTAQDADEANGEGPDATTKQDAVNPAAESGV